MLVLAVVVAAILRFWQLGQIPPGLYRDEAFNGLDAIRVLNGQGLDHSPFFFPANNGREPLFIYLTAVAVQMLGRTALAVRMAAAVIGTLTTWVTYQLAKSWFGQGIGLIAAWMWAITIWPVHLSRIGLRPILLPLLLALSFWLATLAYRRQVQGQPAVWLWLMTGVAFGTTFYTYLAARFLPVIVLVLLIYLALTSRGKLLWPGFGWALLSAAVVLLPLAYLSWQQPELILGRTGQVSILNPDIHGGDLVDTLGHHIWRSIGMFFYRGDSIIRHNPPGQPVFNWLLTMPFLLGVGWCLKNWRRPAAVTLLLWVSIMIWPTILAEDPPHFLRAVGILPGILILPAIGLALIWRWPRLPSRIGPAAVVLIIIVSLIGTIQRYFVDYGQDPVTSYWFEEAPVDLAQAINRTPDEYTIYVDQRFWDGWAGFRFLLSPDKVIHFYHPDELAADEIQSPAAIFAWPHENTQRVTAAIASPAQVSGTTGSMAQGDFDPAPYPFYITYLVEEPDTLTFLANFDNSIQLRDATVNDLGDGQLLVNLQWSTEEDIEDSYVTFVHVYEGNINAGALLGQSDTIPGQGNWPTQRWKPGFIIHDQHLVQMNEPYDPTRHQIRVGLYQADSLNHLAVLDENGKPTGDAWLLRP